MIVQSDQMHRCGGDGTPMFSRSGKLTNSQHRVFRVPHRKDESPRKRLSSLPGIDEKEEEEDRIGAVGGNFKTSEELDKALTKLKVRSLHLTIWTF